MYTEINLFSISKRYIYEFVQFTRTMLELVTAEEKFMVSSKSIMTE